MSYRCEVCGGEATGKLRKHVLYRLVPRLPKVVKMGRHTASEGGTRREIAREIPACPGCLEHLGRGVPLAELIANKGQPAAVVVVNGHALPGRRRKYQSLAERLGTDEGVFTLAQIEAGVGTAG